jgi:hypothetical protein
MGSAQKRCLTTFGCILLAILVGCQHGHHAATAKVYDRAIEILKAAPIRQTAKRDLLNAFAEYENDPKGFENALDNTLGTGDDVRQLKSQLWYLRFPQAKESDELAKRQAALGSDQEKNDWPRMKECSEQAERVARRAGWIEGQEHGIITLEGWQNHYSAKSERCFIQASYFHADTAFFSDELYDAFEGRLVAQCTDSTADSAPLWCDIEGRGPHQNCKACREFINERMGK